MATKKAKPLTRAELVKWARAAGAGRSFLDAFGRAPEARPMDVLKRWANEGLSGKRWTGDRMGNAAWVVCMTVGRGGHVPPADFDARWAEVEAFIAHEVRR
jgi:hypothetical protein